MTYLVTARKWRPMVFEDVAGQSHVTTTLRNAIATNRLSHAYIFSGPRGVGKTTTARILAKAINCLQPKEYNPDNECELCTEITEGRSLNVFEIDGASNRGVDEIRNLREAVRYGPSKGKYKVYIIDEVHMLTKEAFNALLKTLEEPPAHVLFIFATTEVHKVPLTILSRCQRFDFRRIAAEEIIARLRFIAKEENISIDDEALVIIAKRADGSLRDAQSIFDQIVSYCGETIVAKQIIDMFNIVDSEIYFRITDIIKAKDPKTALLLVEEIVSRGFDIREILGGLNEHFRNLLVTAAIGSTHLIETSEVYKKRYQEYAQSFSENDLLRFIKIVNDIESAIRWSPQPRLKLEIGLLQLIKMDGSIAIEQLLQQLQYLKKKLSSQSPAGTKENSKNVIETEPHILGSVKASQPVLHTGKLVHPLLSVSEPSASYSRSSISTQSRTSVATMQPAMEEQTTVTVSVDEAIGKWSLFIDEARKLRIDLGTMLSDSRLVEMKDNRLYVGCPDDFHIDALKRNRDFLSDLAQRVYGAKIRLETVLSSEPHKPSPPIPRNSTERDASLCTKQDNHQHPVIQALIQEFGVEQID